VSNTLAPGTYGPFAITFTTERRGSFDLAFACRVPDDAAPPPDVRFAGLPARPARPSPGSI
jgi:hypothetical protein